MNPRDPHLCFLHASRVDRYPEKKSPDRCPGFGNTSISLLPVKRRCRIVLGHDPFGVLGQGLRLRQQLETLDHLRILFRANLQTFILPEGVDEDL